MSARSDRRGYAATAVALAAHGAVALALAWRTGAGPVPVLDEGAAIELEPLDLPEQPAPVPLPLPESPHEPGHGGEARAAPAGAAARGDARVSGLSKGSATSAATPPEAPSAEAAPGGAWMFSPAAGGGPPEGTSAGGALRGAGLDRAVRDGVAATLAEDRRDERARRKANPVPGFTPRDYALGMVPGTALASSARDLVRRSLVPDEASAVLQFDTDGAGLVSAFRVLSASSAWREWGEVAAQIASDARAKPVRVPPGARGVAITLEVSSTLRTVDGAPPPRGAVDGALRALNDPAGALTRVPLVRVVAARVVDVAAY